MLADDPRHQFLRYSLAMELQKEGRSDESSDLLKGLMADEEPYAERKARQGPLPRPHGSCRATASGIRSSWRHWNRSSPVGEVQPVAAAVWKIRRFP